MNEMADQNENRKWTVRFILCVVFAAVGGGVDYHYWGWPGTMAGVGIGGLLGLFPEATFFLP